MYRLQDGLPEEQHTKRLKGEPEMENIYIIIPALEPGPGLEKQVGELQVMIPSQIVVIDDGSGEDYRERFDRIAVREGCVVLRHTANRGKGQALKTGFRYVRENGGDRSMVLCTDCDGQHLPSDGVKLLKAAGRHPGALVLGTRDFNRPDVPWKSRMGNNISSLLFRLAGGINLSDTQTGLRAFDGSLLDLMIQIPGDRFEYETCVLLVCARKGIPVLTEEIETVYVNDNEGTHFRPVRDSIMVMSTLFREFGRFGLTSEFRSSLPTGTIGDGDSSTGEKAAVPVPDEKKRNIWFILTIFFSTIYLLWRIFFTIPWEAGILQAFAGILLALAETVTTLGMIELMINRMKSGGYVIPFPDVPGELFPDVDVFIATHNESAKLLYKTVNACTFLEYPDQSKVHIYVCDDGDREEIRRMSEHLGVGYLGLAGNRHAKSGNYNNALSLTSSPLIATFDADMIPRREFLIRTVPYFLIPDKKIGLVQTPQSFYNQDLFQFNLFSEKDIPNEQDFFSREVNVMRNTANAAAYTGSNTVILRSAMEEIGGFPYDTVTEDFEVSLRLQKAGYITYATTEVLAAGLSTTTVGSMIGQRVRWARGVIQSIQNTNAVFTKDLSIAARLSYLNAYLYWWSFLCRMIFILSPVLFALFGFRLVECGFWELLLFWLPSHLSYRVSMEYLSTNIRNMRWSQIIDTILAPYLIIPVFMESVGIHQKKFKVTDKKKQRVRTASSRYLIPHGILIFLTLISILHFVRGKFGMALVYSSVILFWLGYNLIALLYAVFFMLGRESRRISDRIGAEEQAEVLWNGRRRTGRTVDVSEEGIALRIMEMLPVKPGDVLKINVFTENYRAVLEGKCVYCREETEQKDNKKGLFLAAVVTPEEETDRRNWLQIIHDREHSLPREIDPWMTVYDEVCRNVRMRLERR